MSGTGGSNIESEPDVDPIAYSNLARGHGEGRARSGAKEGARPSYPVQGKGLEISRSLFGLRLANAGH
jgi:hypothetical protein